jgi:hypothetical protein
MSCAPWADAARTFVASSLSIEFTGEHPSNRATLSPDGGVGVVVDVTL